MLRLHADYPSRQQPAGWLLLWQLMVLLTLASLAGCASLPANVQRTPSRAFSAPEETPLGRLSQQRQAQAGARSDSGFHLLGNVDTAFTSRLALVEGAQRSLDLQYYAIHADASTELLLQRIREAARRGVRVRILLDDFNTVGEDAQVLRLAFEPGVDIRLFNPLPGPRGSLIGRLLGSLHDVERIQKRMHNKLFLADNAWGITGGRNLGDAYFGSGEKSNFVDLDVLAAGRIVRDMSRSFDRYWNDELAYPVQTLLSQGDLDRLREQRQTSPPDDPSRPPLPARAIPASLPAASPDTVLPGVSPAAVAQERRPPLDLQRVPLVWAPSVLLVDKPDKVGPDEGEADTSETVIDGLLQLMEQARQEVLIISPYFVPGPQMMATFAKLRARGIPVRVLTNSLASNDAPAAHAGYARHRPDLLRLGVELHEMRADPGTAGSLSGSGRGSGRGRSGFGLGSGAGGSKSGSSRASLHSKAVIIDRRLAVIGSMNLDLRSQLQNSEVALVIRSRVLSQQAAELITTTFATGAYRVVLQDDGLRWQAPPGAAFPGTDQEPEASLRLRLLVRLIAPFAPDEML
ncbi:phospholipase D-like domain-containing protein [Ramlibacter tataouinensis]|uniref:Cardiolipin synthetase (Cardiolipin synthase)-like protein n=1 Tax=Ramlibacter tataouinensis (strain ATCC BAA-407 / DSM 14655 / LMG 21543 / TTB310) TaxID=365046 RepID=F5XVP3_RAMTT|nr:phospholipase D family protein [Ramlibacter tataouinensis]AEG91619.1 cardiolipin synthetase (Cardiolipin synthase)-like protein [Ramlibacter tataouinensis TTB310]